MRPWKWKGIFFFFFSLSSIFRERSFHRPFVFGHFPPPPPPHSWCCLFRALIINATLFFRGWVFVSLLREFMGRRIATYYYFLNITFLFVIKRNENAFMCLEIGNFFLLFIPAVYSNTLCYFKRLSKHLFLWTISGLIRPIFIQVNHRALFPWF